MGSSCAVGLSRALLPSESVYLSRRSHQFIRQRSSLGCFAVQGLASQRRILRAATRAAVIISLRGDSSPSTGAIRTPLS
ncbi:hypothetical protein MUK42_35606 [Musa troglodytarum]|uniref:Uncharacterized protein n=1 Tax=Musa troglodytarum TaxID=320322 RepID=A0A9E7K9C4_9LILI|nr:hypothetical protein MUK42_35606 [Musa troglodytarum]